MSATSVITDKEALHKAPPDILLTNYNQLDTLRLQPHVQSLWAHKGRLPDGRGTRRIALQMLEERGRGSVLAPVGAA
jgi:DEAD/DEAH box helicase domain-containing protein